MKRYFEVIFDDSASMNEVPVGWMKTVSDAGKEIFEETVFPHLNGPDHVVTLRLLRETPETHQGCEPAKRGISPNTTFFGDPDSLRNAVRCIHHFVKWTPLYLTIRDALDECKRRKITGEYLDFRIFILTDGGDTCDIDFDVLCSKQEIDEFHLEFPLLQPVLVQLNISSPVTRNNLETAIRRLGGLTVSVPNSDTRSARLVSKALQRANFSGAGKMPQCIEPAETPAKITWNELEREGILYHQAMILSKGGLLEFTPILNQALHHDNLVELRFVHAMVFRSHLAIDTVRSMVAQLERPLLYSHDCIHWDFTSARWKFQEDLKTEFLKDPEARKIEEQMLRQALTFHEDIPGECVFSPDFAYIVTERKGNFQLRPESSNKLSHDPTDLGLEKILVRQASPKKNIRWLSPGTIVRFTEK
jgi:hypothetical protein